MELRRCTGQGRARRLRGVSRRRGEAIALLGRGSGATGRRGHGSAEERRGAELVEAAARVYGGALLDGRGAGGSWGFKGGAEDLGEACPS